MNKRQIALGFGALATALGCPDQAWSQAEGLKASLSGQIDRAILYANDGTEKDWFNVDNGNSSTRFRFTADAPVGPGLKAGILFEVEYRSNPSSTVAFGNRSISPTLDERHMDIFLAGGFGAVRLGQGDGAANGASEVDLSGTTVAHYASTPDVGGGFEYRTGGVLSGTSIGTTISNQDFESRYDRLHYLTPDFQGFSAQASWGNKATDVVEFSERYSRQLAGPGQLAGAVGYSKEDAAPGGTDDKTVGGSVSWLHGSGINVTLAHTSRDLPGRTGRFDYLKVGYKFGGNHAVSVDYAKGKN